MIRDIRWPREPDLPIRVTCPVCGMRYDERKDWICPTCRYGEWELEDKADAALKAKD